MKAEYFTEERHTIRREWNLNGEGIDWYDFLYLFSGRLETDSGVLSDQIN
jgi:hypothetical protein